MLTRIGKMSKMSYLNIQNRSCIKIWRFKCNGKGLKHMAHASDCALALYHLNAIAKITKPLLR